MKLILNDTLEPNNYNFERFQDNLEKSGPAGVFDHLKHKMNTTIAGTGVSKYGDVQGVHYNDRIAILAGPDLTGVLDVNKSFMYLLSRAYSAHHKIRISPHDLWYIVLTEMAHNVITPNVEACRPLFTRSNEKVDIVVETNDPTTIDLKLVEAQLRGLVPVDIDQFLPQFSTLTPNASYACLAAFCDAVSHYYNYMTLCCGIPAIEIDGTPDDWQMVLDQSSFLTNMFSTVGLDIRDWMARVQTAGKYIQSALVTGDPTDMMNIFTQQNVGSGGEKDIDGWFKDIFFKPERRLDNIPSAMAKVSYKNIDTGQEYHGFHGCFLTRQTADGFYYGDYAELIVQRHPFDATKDDVMPKMTITKETVKKPSDYTVAAYKGQVIEQPPIILTPYIPDN